MDIIRFKLSSGETFVLHTNQATNKSRRATKNRVEAPRTKYGWESSRQTRSLNAPGARFWYKAVTSDRTECIVRSDTSGLVADPGQYTGRRSDTGNPNWR